MMNGRKEWGRTWGIYWDGSSNREEREINRWIDTNALSAFFFLLISSLQLKRLSVSQKRLSQQGTVSIVCFLLCLFSIQQHNRRPLNVCGDTGILKKHILVMQRQPLHHVIYSDKNIWQRKITPYQQRINTSKMSQPDLTEQFAKTFLRELGTKSILPGWNYEAIGKNTY